MGGGCSPGTTQLSYNSDNCLIHVRVEIEAKKVNEGEIISVTREVI